MLVKIAKTDIKEFLDWANNRAFCNSGQYIVDRIATIFESIPSEPQHGREPDKVKSLAQYLAEYLDRYLNGETLPHELLKQALNTYQSTENVTIKIERK